MVNFSFNFSQFGHNLISYLPRNPFQSNLNKEPPHALSDIFLTKSHFDSESTSQVAHSRVSFSTQIDEKEDEINSALEQEAANVREVLDDNYDLSNLFRSPESFLELFLMSEDDLSRLKREDGRVGLALEFLTHLLPKEFINHPELFEDLETMSIIQKNSSIFINAVSVGSNGIALTCKARILQKMGQLYEEIEESFKEGKFKDRSLSQNEQDLIAAMLTKWKANLEFERQNLDAETLRSVVSVISVVTSAISLPIKYFPNLFFIVPQILAWGKIFLGGFGLFLKLVDVVLAFIDMKRAQKSADLMDAWKDKFRVWVKATEVVTQVGGVGEEGLTKVIENNANKIKNLLAKRQGIKEANKVELSGSFDKCEPEIKKLHRDFFESSMKRIDEITRQLSKTWLKDVSFELLEKLDQIAGQVSSTCSSSESSEILKEIQRIKNQVIQLRSHADVSVELIESIQSIIKTISSNVSIDNSTLLKELLQSTTQLSKARSKGANLELLEKEFERWKCDDHLFPDEDLNSKWGNFLANFNDTANESDLERSETQFLQALQNFMKKNNHFEKWYAAQSRDNLIYSYVDHKRVIELTTSQSLKQLVDLKLSFEKQFIDFQKLKKSISFVVTLASLAFITAVVVSGFFMPPMAIFSILLILVTFGGVSSSLGLMGAGFYLAFKHKPRATINRFLGEPVHLIYIKARLGLKRFKYHLDTKKFLVATKVLKELHKNHLSDEKKINRATSSFEDAERLVEKSHAEIQVWLGKLAELESKAQKSRWLDFAQANLLETSVEKDEMDILKRLNEAINDLDVTMLDLETKEIFTTFLGVDIKLLKQEFAKNPESFKNALQKFFAFTDSSLIAFIRSMHVFFNQNLKKKKNL